MKKQIIICILAGMVSTFNLRAVTDSTQEIIAPIVAPVIAPIVAPAAAPIMAGILPWLIPTAKVLGVGSVGLGGLMACYYAKKTLFYVKKVDEITFDDYAKEVLEPHKHDLLKMLFSDIKRNSSGEYIPKPILAQQRKELKTKGLGLYTSQVLYESQANKVAKKTRNEDDEEGLVRECVAVTFELKQKNFQTKYGLSQEQLNKLHAQVPAYKTPLRSSQRIGSYLSVNFSLEDEESQPKATSLYSFSLKIVKNKE